MLINKEELQLRKPKKKNKIKRDQSLEIKINQILMTSMIKVIVLEKMMATLKRSLKMKATGTLMSMMTQKIHANHINKSSIYLRSK